MRPLTQGRGRSRLITRSTYEARGTMELVVIRLVECLKDKNWSVHLERPFRLSLEPQASVQVPLSRWCSLYNTRAGQLRTFYPSNVQHPLHHGVRLVIGLVDCLTNDHSSVVPSSSSRRSIMHIALMPSLWHASRDSSRSIPAPCTRPVAPWSWLSGLPTV